MDKETVLAIMDEAKAACDPHTGAFHSTQGWMRFSRQVGKSGWDAGKVYIRDQDYRCDVCFANL